MMNDEATGLPQEAHGETLLEEEYRESDPHLDHPQGTVVDGQSEFHIGLSASVDKLFTALAKAQASISNPSKNQKNEYYDSGYADLTSVRNATQSALSANGLSICQIPGTSGELVLLTTVLAHSSGQYILGRMSMTPTRVGPHGQMSCVTYMRRAMWASMTGCTPAGDDDDGNLATALPESQRQKKQGRGTNVDRLRSMLKSMGIADRETADIVVRHCTRGAVANVEEAKGDPKLAGRTVKAIQNKMNGRDASDLILEAKKHEETGDNDYKHDNTEAQA